MTKITKLERKKNDFKKVEGRELKIGNENWKLNEKIFVGDFYFSKIL